MAKDKITQIPYWDPEDEETCFPGRCWKPMKGKKMRAMKCKGKKKGR